MVTVVYWSLLKDEVLAKHAGNLPFYINSILVHSVPLVATFANFCVTDIVFKPSHCMVYVPIGIIYSYLNYHSTVTTGIPVYWFLDWKDYRSSLIVMILLTANILFFLIMSKLTEVIRKHRP